MYSLVGVQALYCEWKGVDQVFQQGQQKGLADLGDRADELILGEAIDEVDVVDTFDAVEIALMD